MLRGSSLGFLSSGYRLSLIAFCCLAEPGAWRDPGKLAARERRGQMSAAPANTQSAGRGKGVQAIHLSRTRGWNEDQDDQDMAAGIGHFDRGPLAGGRAAFRPGRRVAAVGGWLGDSVCG